MISTYTNEIRKAIIDDYLSYNLVVALIYKPSLGLTDSPTSIETTNRLNLTMTEVALAEIGATTLNGYARFIVNLPNALNTDPLRLSGSSTLVKFRAKEAVMDAFTHVVAIRGADIRNATLLNGNNRGSNIGTVIRVEPVISAPISLSPPQSYTYPLSFAITSRPINN